jgi:hypothetical protein
MISVSHSYVTLPDLYAPYLLVFPNTAVCHYYSPLLTSYPYPRLLHDHGLCAEARLSDVWDGCDSIPNTAKLTPLAVVPRWFHATRDTLEGRQLHRLSGESKSSFEQGPHHSRFQVRVVFSLAVGHCLFLRYSLHVPSIYTLVCNLVKPCPVH